MEFMESENPEILSTGASSSVNLNYLVIFNVCKKNNVKSLVYTATAYNFIPIVVGVPSLIKDLHVGDATYLYYETLREVKEFLMKNLIPLIGIEIFEGARSILENPFTTRIALMPGNEGTGLNSTQIRAADGFVYIPQYGVGTASLNVNVATAIVLNQYCAWNFQNVS